MNFENDPIAAEMSAGTIKKRALLILNYEYNCECWEQNNTTAVRGRNFRGRKGVADIIGFERKGTGKLVMCEVKKIGDKFKPDQIELLTKVHNAGAIALWATQDGLKVVVKKFIE